MNNRLGICEEVILNEHFLSTIVKQHPELTQGWPEFWTISLTSQMRQTLKNYQERREKEIIQDQEDQSLEDAQGGQYMRESTSDSNQNWLWEIGRRDEIARRPEERG